MQYSKVSQKMLPLKNKSMERSSRSHMFFKIGVLKNFANSTGKHLSWSLFLTKFFTDLETPTQMLSCTICKIFKNTFFYRTPQVAATVERDSNAGVLPVEFAKFLRTLLLVEQLRWLLLNGHLSRKIA